LIQDCHDKKGPGVPIRTILDTDIGTDVDDCLAIALILGSPELTLEGVTCVYGDVALRGRMVRKLLMLRDIPDIPIRLGASQPLIGLREVYWAGHEGEGLIDGDPDEPFSSEHAVDYLVRTVMTNPGEIHLLAIGPLTNVALAMVKEPRLASNLAHLTIMGGAFRGPDSASMAIAEHNILCDPEAAHVVLSSGAPMTLVPLDVTTRCSIRPEHVARLRALGDPYHDAVAEQVERYPRFHESGSTFLHDPLAAAVIIQPDLVELTALNVAVETQGRLTSGMTVMRAPSDRSPSTARVALTVDTPRAEEFIASRLLA
jgi:purine nucleosidase